MTPEPSQTKPSQAQAEPAGTAPQQTPSIEQPIEHQRQIAAALGIPVARRHIFLCADASKPKCCDAQRSLQAWEYLKKRLKELGLSEQGGIQRSKANCLRICEAGPIAVVYPEGVWYRACDEAVLERIIQEHLINGCIVTEHAIIEHKLQ